MVSTSSAMQCCPFPPLSSFVCPSFVPVLGCMMSWAETAHGLASLRSAQVMHDDVAW